MDKFGKICKEYMIKEMGERLSAYRNFFFTASSRITVSDIERLRKDLKQNSALYMVVKNSLAKQAFGKTISGEGLQDISSFVSGHCGIIFSKSDPSLIARLLVNFRKQHENFNIRGGFVNGEKITSEVIDLLATLPPRKILLSIVLSSMEAPISRLVNFSAALLQNLIGTIDAISKKKAETQN